MKKCSYCKIIKNLSDFSKNIKNRDLLDNSCKECSRSRAKLSYKKNASKKKAYVKNYDASKRI